MRDCVSALLGKVLGIDEQVLGNPSDTFRRQRFKSIETAKEAIRFVAIEFWTVIS